MDWMENCDNYYREKLAAWMRSQGIATGHGDTFDDLLVELAIEIAQLRDPPIEETL